MNKSGFTLIELIAVMLILGVLACVVIPRFISFDSNADAKVTGYQQTATDRYEMIRKYGLETGLDTEGNDVNEDEGNLTKEKSK